MWKVPFFDLNYNDEEKKAVEDVLNNKWISAGVKVKEFEEEFSKYLSDNVYSISVSNCTAALYMALKTNNIGIGDEVIIPALTFVADLNVVTMTGATPVLADCTSKTDWNINVEDIREKITEKTRAIIIVHFAGYPCDMEKIVNLAKEKKLILIEDAAHAIGSVYKGKKCGTFGDVACFSFFSNKNLSTGEGGMIVTKSPKLSEKAKLLRSHGMTSMTIDRYDGKVTSYDVLDAGFNYRSDEIKAALGLVQLTKLDKANEQREKNVLEYIDLLKDIKEITIPFLKNNNNIKSSYHIFPILLNENIDRQKVVNYLKERSIQTSIHYPSFKKFNYYTDILKNEITPIADDISEKVLTLPLYPNMDKADIKYVCDNLKEALMSK